MLFLWTANLIADGKKTQTRRLVRPGDSLGYVTDSGVRHPAVINVTPVYDGRRKQTVEYQRIRWVVGRIYGVQPGLMKSSACWIRITGLHREVNPLEICDADARAEGYQDAADFVAHWKKNHRLKAGDPPKPVWVISFKVVRKPKRK